MSLYPECELAIDDIINEALVVDREEAPVAINLENINISPNIKEKIAVEFHEVLKLLRFRDTGYDTLKNGILMVTLLSYYYRPK